MSPPLHANGLQPVAGRWRAFSILFVIYVANFVDRSILGILNQPIKEDLGLSDSELGFINGLAFALFYTVMGLPLARLADRWIRRHLLIICLTVWSFMTMLSGFATVFWQLVLARIGVAIGEAGATPASHSMISDLFGPEERTSALSIYSGAASIGIFIGMLLGGFVADHLGWRWAFIIAGAPGLLLALVAHIYLKEPERGGADQATRVVEQEAPPIREVFKRLFVEYKSFRYMAIAASLHNFTSVGVTTWLPAFLVRSHSLSYSEIGMWLAGLSLCGSFVGVVIGGIFTERLGKLDIRWFLWVPALASLLSIPFAAFCFIHDNHVIALIVYVVPSILGHVFLGPAYGMAQNLAGTRMRAFASTILLFMGVLIGQGLGPQFVGVVSDALYEQTTLGDESLRYALLSALSFSAFATVFYLMAAPHFRSNLDMAAAHNRQLSTT